MPHVRSSLQSATPHQGTNPGEALWRFHVNCLRGPSMQPHPYLSISQFIQTPTSYFH